MRFRKLAIACGLLVMQGVVPSVHAGSLAGALVSFDPVLSRIKLGNGLALGDVDLRVFHLDGLPGIGGVAGTITVRQGFDTLSSITELQRTLPGLDRFFVIRK